MRFLSLFNAGSVCLCGVCSHVSPLVRLGGIIIFIHRSITLGISSFICYRAREVGSLDLGSSLYYIGISLPSRCAIGLIGDVHLQTNEDW